VWNEPEIVSKMLCFYVYKNREKVQTWLSGSCYKPEVQTWFKFRFIIANSVYFAVLYFEGFTRSMHEHHSFTPVAIVAVQVAMTWVLSLCFHTWFFPVTKIWIPFVSKCKGWVEWDWKCFKDGGLFVDEKWGKKNKNASIFTTAGNVVGWKKCDSDLPQLKF
jgi:hypothetical protein